MSDKVMRSSEVKGSRNGAKKCYEFGHRNKRGEPCGANVIAGTTACPRHSGKKLAKAKAEGAVVVELQRWGLGDTTVDPGEVLLRLVSQSAARCELYAGLLGEAFAAADRMRAAHEAQALVAAPEAEGGEGPEDPAVQAARADLERIFNTGGVAALIGHRYDADRDGRVFPVDEAIRGLARLEAEERDRCANFAAKAVAAGLAERQVRLAEQQGALVAGVFRRALDAAGLSAEVRAAVEAALVREIQAVAGIRVIEGVVG
jgi:hypothetical protein